MSRVILAAITQQLEASHGADDLLVFVDLVQANLPHPIHVVNDNATFNGLPATYNVNGTIYQAFPFSITLFSDDDQAPHARMEIANVDRVIGQSVMAANTPIGMTISLYPPSAFNLTVNPRVALSLPLVPVYQALNLHISNVTVDAMSVTADILSLDDTQEPFPRTRAIATILPGLFLA